MSIVMIIFEAILIRWQFRPDSRSQRARFQVHWKNVNILDYYYAKQCVCKYTRFIDKINALQLCSMNLNRCSHIQMCFYLFPRLIYSCSENGPNRWLKKVSLTSDKPCFPCQTVEACISNQTVASEMHNYLIILSGIM